MSTPTTTAPAQPPAPPEPPRPAALRVALRALAIGLALLLVAYGAVAAASLLARETHSTHASFQGVAVVSLDTSFESVDIVAVPGATSVDVERRWTWSTREPSVSTRRVGDRLVVSSHCSWSPGLPCTGRVSLDVPPDVRVLGSTADGHLLLRGLTGPVDLRTADGGVELRDLTGPLRISARDGSLRATGLTSDRVTVHSTDGGVQLGFAEPPTAVRASTTDGSVEIVVPDDGTAYDVSVSVSDGSRDVLVPIDSRSDRRIAVTTSDGSVRVGNDR